MGWDITTEVLKQDTSGSGVHTVTAMIRTFTSWRSSKVETHPCVGSVIGGVGRSAIDSPWGLFKNGENETQPFDHNVSLRQGNVSSPEIRTKAVEIIDCIASSLGSYHGP